VGQLPGGTGALMGLGEPWSLLAGLPVPVAPANNPEEAAFGFSWE